MTRTTTVRVDNTAIVGDVLQLGNSMGEFHRMYIRVDTIAAWRQTPHAIVVLHLTTGELVAIHDLDGQADGESAAQMVDDLLWQRFGLDRQPTDKPVPAVDDVLAAAERHAGSIPTGLALALANLRTARQGA